VTTPANMPNSSPLAETWVDNLPLSALVEALRLNPQENIAQLHHGNDRFWSTPARPAESPLQEVMQVTLSSEHVINFFSFEVSNFPVDISLEYYDSQKRKWIPIADASDSSGLTVKRSILDSRPGVIPSVTSMTGHTHPQHSFAGHWRFLEFFAKPLRAKDLRVVLQRTARGTPPTNVFGQQIDYSLAIRNFYCGYRVNSRSDVPKTEPLTTSTSQYLPFATATDALGSGVQYSLRVNRPVNLLAGAADNAVWKSEPQPVPWAVVNLYVDTRDLRGDPQLIDQFLLEPLQDGVRFNLYWAGDEPDGSFEPNEDPIPYPLISTLDGSDSVTDVLHGGEQNKDEIGYVDIDNRYVGFDPARAWWIGGTLAFKFEHGSQSIATPVLDFGEFYVAMTPFGLRVTTRHGDTLLVRTDPMSIGTPFHFVAAHTNGALELWVRQGLVDYYGAMTVTVPLSRYGMATTLRFGGFQGDDPGIADFDLAALVVKIDSPISSDIASQFFEDYADFIEGDLKSNALLRYHESFSSSNYREGFIGGPPDRYASLEWNPIARDFLLRKGYLTVPPTKARYWKFEFCGLVPQHYEVFRPIRRVVRTFIPKMWIPYPDPATLKASIRQLFPGVLTNIDNGVTSYYRDASISSMGTGGIGKGYTATTARIIRNSEVRGAISGQYFIWNYLPLHGSQHMPCFEKRSVHEYEALTVDHVEKIGYFVGLKSIQPFRLDYLATDDTPEYVETFVDQTNIDNDGNWLLDEDHHFHTGAAHYAEARSVPFTSNRVVRAVQFATQQSDPLQILPDDDFLDPAHTSWTAVGDATLAPELTTHQVLGTMLQIDRAPQPGSWGQIELSATDWLSVNSFTFGALESPTTTISTIGGVSSLPLSMPSGGQVHVAARIIAPAGLAEPLHVQIYDEVADRVLADEQVDVEPNKVTEWFTSYPLDDLQSADVFRWKDFAATQMGPTFQDNFTRSNATSLGIMQSGHRWNAGPNGSLVISSNMASVGVEGQSNWVDGLAPWGTLELSLGTAGTGSTGLVKVAEWEPIFIASNGQVRYSGGAGLYSGSVLTTSGSARSIQTNDIIKIEILPSRYVPVGKEDVAYATRDDVVRPYSFMVYLNGTWVHTVSHDHGARTIRGIIGRIGQQFKLFKWTPQSYGRLVGPVIMRYPHQGYGSYTDSSNRKFIDNEGFVWTAEGIWDIATSSETPTDAGVGVPLTAGVNDSVMVVDTQVRYGSMTATVRNVASTFGTAAKHGKVLCLDYENGIYVNYAGNVVDVNGTNYGNLFTGGIADNSRVTVQWVRTALVNSVYRVGIDPNVFPDMLISKVGGVYVKSFVHANLTSWRGTVRGLAGDLYDPTGGSRPGGANYTLDTSFQSFNWAPDAYHTPQVTGPTWGNVTHEGHATYDSATQFKTREAQQLSARVVQYGVTNDLWFVDTLSMFIDPIRWYFSNDGGVVFYPALNIRNSPNGALLFPTSTAVVDPSQVPGTSLVWKVVAFAPGCNVSNLVIRPWYGGALSAISHQIGLGGAGPNIMPYDQYSDLRNDARFQAWNKPIPQAWWYQYRTIRPPTAEPPSTGPDLYLSPDMIIEVED
jgi:hypothetical protein